MGDLQKFKLTRLRGGALHTLQRFQRGDTDILPVLKIHVLNSDSVKLNGFRLEFMCYFIVQLSENILLSFNVLKLCHTKGRQQPKSVREQGAETDIWTQQTGRKRKLK